MMMGRSAWDSSDSESLLDSGNASTPEVLSQRVELGGAELDPAYGEMSDQNLKETVALV